jgi:hypothetical protein
MNKSANKPRTDKPKPKRKAPKSAWKPGQSGNPKGRPKDGQSWREVLTELSNMTTEDILLMIGADNDLGRNIKLMPKNVQMKYLVGARVIAALMFEPTSGLWNGLMDRIDGKVPDQLKISNLLEVDGLEARLTLLYGKNKDSSGRENRQDDPSGN